MIMNNLLSFIEKNRKELESLKMNISELLDPVSVSMLEENFCDLIWSDSNYDYHHNPINEDPNSVNWYQIDAPRVIIDLFSVLMPSTVINNI